MMAGYFSSTPSIAISPPSSEGDPHSPIACVETHQHCHDVYASIDAPSTIVAENSRKIRRRRSIGNEIDLIKDLSTKGYFLEIEFGTLLRVSG